MKIWCFIGLCNFNHPPPTSDFCDRPWSFVSPELLCMVMTQRRRNNRGNPISFSNLLPLCYGTVTSHASKWPTPWPVRPQITSPGSGVVPVSQSQSGGRIMDRTASGQPAATCSKRGQGSRCRHCKVVRLMCGLLCYSLKLPSPMVLKFCHFLR